MTGQLEKDAEYCDSKAEARNDHDYVGAHRVLAALLYQEVGREVATRIMKRIKRLKGLDGMVGMDGIPPAFEKLGVTEPWNKWFLPE